MSDRPNDYGILLNKNAKLYRKWFSERTKLLGINCIFKAPMPGKTYNKNGDLSTAYMPGKVVGCIFHDHPDQKTLKKLGWVAELDSNSSRIEVPYDLAGLQVGALFIVPSGLDAAKGRVFRVINRQTSMVYPASITCEIAPEYEDLDEPNQFTDFKNENMPVLADVEGED